jgi:acetoin utilization deacetylase AcuC-like enzyme
MGFCYINNIAVAARHVQRSLGRERVLIVDWDVHHGNGTQHAFEDDPTAMFCSLHEDPRYQYPGTGFATETGRGAGEGYTLNVPMLPGANDEAYRSAFEEVVLPAGRRFGPDFVLISAGFDAHAADPLGHLSLTDAVFRWMAEQVFALADECCNGRVVSVLEGGYDLPALGRCVADHVEAMLA